MNINAIIAALMQDGEAFKCTIECERHSITILGAKKTTVVNVNPAPVPPPVTAETLWRPDVPPSPRPPIPKNVFYHPPTTTFWAASGKICEVAFFNTWCHRAEEFPVWMGPDMLPPIPKGVYYDVMHDNFYSTKTSFGMGSDFYVEWVSRREEFPTKAEECT